MSKDRTNRAVIFANGPLKDPQDARHVLQEDDLLIAANGGARHCLNIGLTPDILIGDFDSLTQHELTSLEDTGMQIIQHPAKKDYTDLELAVRHAVSLGLDEILVIGALGARWDQTIANILLPVINDLSGIRMRMIDGDQEVTLMRDEDRLTLHGGIGDILSLIPLGGDAIGVTTEGLEYALDDETLYFGATRGISNVMLEEKAEVQLRSGYLLCIMIHLDRHEDNA